jgi:hypothetical protein
VRRLYAGPQQGSRARGPARDRLPPVACAPSPEQRRDQIVGGAGGLVRPKAEPAFEAGDTVDERLAACRDRRAIGRRRALGEREDRGGPPARRDAEVTRWPTEKHLASWLSLAPGSKVSGGKPLSGRTKPSASRVAAALRLVASSLYHSRSALGAFHRRLKARLGAPKAITATAHKLARLIYRMLRFGTEYVDVGQDYYERRYQRRVVSTLMRRAHVLGYTLVKNPDLPTASSPA